MKKLDPRIKDRKYIFDCFNADEAKKYIGKKCYMTDYFERFDDVESTAKCTLKKIDEDGFFTDGEDDFRFTYCLPMELVAPKEKKYRPYTLMEFEEKFHIGLPIQFRKKDEVENKRFLILSGYWHEDKTTYVYIGPHVYTLVELFNKYEWQSHYTEDYQPFGVEE